MGVVLYAANEGYLNDIPVAKLGAFESALLSYMSTEHGELMDKISDTGAYGDDVAEIFKSAIEAFKATQTW
jgi:F-type H+-transporting ATPase subunit alpha